MIRTRVLHAPSPSMDSETHRHILKDAVKSKRNDLIDIALRHLHSPTGQPVDLSMVDDALVQEYKQLLQATAGLSGQIPSPSSNDSSPATSIRSGDSAASRSSQTSYDPRDNFDQVLISMIERINLLLPAIKGTKWNRLAGKDRSRRTPLVGYFRSFRDDKLKCLFGMSDAPRRQRIGQPIDLQNGYVGNGLSEEYLRCRHTCYDEILDIQNQLYRICEDENIRRKEILQDDQVMKVRGKLEIWGAQLAVMAELMRNAPLVDQNETAETQTPEAMEVD